MARKEEKICAKNSPLFCGGCVHKGPCNSAQRETALPLPRHYCSGSAEENPAVAIIRVEYHKTRSLVQPHVSNVGAISYVGVQVFGHWHKHVFRSTSTQTAAFATNRFQILPSLALLTRSTAAAKPNAAFFEVGSVDYMTFNNLQQNLEKFERAMTLSRKRGGLDIDLMAEE